MTQAGYYDYAPTVSLARPIACIGHPGCAYREVVYDLAALTGLTLHNLDHRIEHEVGQNLWSYVREHGEDESQRLERALLPGLLSQSPSGIILLGEGALRNQEQLQRVLAQAAVVFFHLPPTSCYWALRRRLVERDGVLMQPWLPDRLEAPHDLQPLLESLRPVAVAADHVIDMEGQSVHDVVLVLQRLLPTLGPAAEISTTPH